MHKLILYITDKNCNWKCVTLNHGVLNLRPKIEIRNMFARPVVICSFPAYKLQNLWSGAYSYNWLEH
jgi:hypothetical protein